MATPTTSFFVPEDTLVSLKNSNKIKKYLNEATGFNPKDTDHTDLLDECRVLVKQDLHALHVLDCKIIGAIAVSIAAIGASIIFPAFGIVSLGALAYLGRLSKQRQVLDEEYRKNLNNLVGCCEWVLADVPKSKQNAIFNCKSVTEMIDTLAPVTNKEQLETMIDDSIEQHFIVQGDNTKEKLAANNDISKKVLGRPLNQKERDLYFSIYGYKQGQWTDILVGLYYLSVHGVSWVKKSVSGLWKEKAAPVEPTEEEASTATATPA